MFTSLLACVSPPPLPAPKERKRGKPAGRADRLHSGAILDPGQHHFSGIKPQLVEPLLTRLREAKIGAATADRSGVTLENEVARQVAALESEEQLLDLDLDPSVGTQAKAKVARLEPREGCQGH